MEEDDPISVSAGGMAFQTLAHVRGVMVLNGCMAIAGLPKITDHQVYPRL